METHQSARCRGEIPQPQAVFSHCVHAADSLVAAASRTIDRGVMLELALLIFCGMFGCMCVFLTLTG